MIIPLKILFKLTTRSRTERAQAAIDSITENCIGTNHFIAITIDDDDKNTFDNLKRYDELFTGISKSKIDAINRDMEKIDYDWNILVNLSDDQLFIRKGFDDIIRNAFSDNLDQFIHFPDQNQGENCCTMSIIGRDYYNRDKFIYDPRFESLWSDIVEQEKAQIRNCYKFVNERIFDHIHPSFGQVPYDEQYRRTEDIQVRQRDYNTYLIVKKEYDPTNIYPIRSL